MLVAQSCLSLSMECPRKDSWSWLPFPAPEDLPEPETEPSSLVSPALAGRFFTTVPSGKPKCQFYWMPKPEMSICLRGSESSAFWTVTHEFHRKTLFVDKSQSGEWTKCPQMPILRMQKGKRGWEHPRWSQAGVRFKWPHEILCVTTRLYRTYGSGHFATFI